MRTSCIGSYVNRTEHIESIDLIFSEDNSVVINENVMLADYVIDKNFNDG